MNREELCRLIDEAVSPKRKRHILGVEETAVALARRFGEDVQKASLAALLHDLFRDVQDARILVMAQELGVTPDAYERRYPGVLHGPVAAAYAQKKLGITDADVLSAIANHTVAAPNMCRLAKMIYVADAIEPNRTYDNVEALRALAQKDLDAAYQKALRQSYELELARGEELHLRTLEALQAMEQEESR